MEKAKVRGDRNQCAGCGELFNSSFAFDKHRTGEFGTKRRCLTVDEMLDKGMGKNTSGYWVSSLREDDFSFPIAEVE